MSSESNYIFIMIISFLINRYNEILQCNIKLFKLRGGEGGVLSLTRDLSILDSSAAPGALATIGLNWYVPGSADSPRRRTPVGSQAYVFQSRILERNWPPFGQWRQNRRLEDEGLGAHRNASTRGIGGPRDVPVEANGRQSPSGRAGTKD